MQQQEHIPATHSSNKLIGIETENKVSGKNGSRKFNIQTEWSQ